MKKHLLLPALVLIAPVMLHAVSINVDFGGSNANQIPPASWNNIIVDASTVNVANALLDTVGASTGITLSYDDYNNTGGFNTNGTTAPTGAAASLPSSVTRDSIFGHTVDFNGDIVPVIHITLSGLNTDQIYQFTYFASRTSVSDVRTTNYALTNGVATSIAVLDASNNTSNLVSSSFMAPSVTGTLTLTLTPDVTNTNASKFFYLGSLQITSTNASAIPEPGSVAALAGAAALGFVASRRRRRS